jgi:hypothetical protein
MPTTIRLTTMPGRIQKGRVFDALVVDLFGPSLGCEELTISKTQEIALAVKRFGEQIRSEHPDGSFKVIVTVTNGSRKPSGFDAANRSGAFGERAFLRAEVANGTLVTPAPNTDAVA